MPWPMFKRVGSIASNHAADAVHPMKNTHLRPLRELSTKFQAPSGNMKTFPKPVRPDCSSSFLEQLHASNACHSARIN
jgi:hypothetical protein